MVSAARFPTPVMVMVMVMVIEPVTGHQARTSTADPKGCDFAANPPHLRGAHSGAGGE
jgi:hypothetical protein